MASLLLLMAVLSLPVDGDYVAYGVPLNVSGYTPGHVFGFDSRSEGGAYFFGEATIHDDGTMTVIWNDNETIHYRPTLYGWNGPGKNDVIWRKQWKR